MPDKKAKERKGLKIMLLIIAGYILLIGGIAAYIKLKDQGYFIHQADVLESTVEVVPSIPSVQYDLPIQDIEVEDQSFEELLNTKGDFPAITSEKDDKSILANDDDRFEEEYAKYERNTIADVPARPKVSTATTSEKPEIISDEIVLSSEDLAYEVEKPKGFWETVKEKVASFFGSDEAPQSEEKIMTPAMLEMLAEIDGEINEMSPSFTSYIEDNGITYIDHINRPDTYGSFGFYIYIGIAQNGYTFHRTVIRYSGESRLYLQNILLQTEESDKALIIEAPEFAQIEGTDEWVDLPPTKENNDMINAVASSDNVKVTFMGKDKKMEWILSEYELATLRESLHFYNLLKEKEELLTN